jgi:hypothetical protein
MVCRPPAGHKGKTPASRARSVAGTTVGGAGAGRITTPAGNAPEADNDPYSDTWPENVPKALVDQGEPP